jgi:NAD dependent epimerase/dehydratase family enzyme
LKKSVPLFKLHLGGSWGRGEQWFTWIHERDVIDSFLFLLAHREIDGPVNFTAPNPVRNREMVTAFIKTLRRKSFIQAIPRPVIQGLLGEFSEVFLKGQRVLPGKLLQHGYHFQFPTLEESLEDLVNH